MKNQTVSLLWLLVEVFCIIRSAIATFQVTMSISNGDMLFAVFTVGVVELSLFAMLLMSGQEPVAPIAAIVLIAFSGVLQFAEMALLTGSMNEQTKLILRYAVSFAPTVLLLVGLIKRLTEKVDSVANLFSSFSQWANLGKSKETAKAFDTSVQNNEWTETRKVKRWRDITGRKHSKSLPSGRKSKK